MTPPEVIARLRELEAKATPGDWSTDHGSVPLGDTGDYCPYWIVTSQRDKNQMIARLDFCADEGDECDANMFLIAALRNTARSLISDAESLAAAEARVKELDAEVERLRPFEPRVLPSNWPHEAKIAHAKGFMEPLVLAFDAMNGECNYTETCVRHGSKEYTVTVRRGDKPTPHELRMAAEARVRELDGAVLELSKGWRWSKSQPDNPIARAAVGKKEAE